MKDQVKQIEEMAKFMCRLYGSELCGEECADNNSCDVERLACNLYDAGYRKQSGWISVDERLPEREGIYLIYTISGHRRLGEFRSYLMDDKPQFDPYTTHWMPLPEPPKGE